MKHSFGMHHDQEAKEAAFGASKPCTAGSSIARGAHRMIRCTETFTTPPLRYGTKISVFISVSMPEGGVSNIA